MLNDIRLNGRMNTMACEGTGSGKVVILSEWAGKVRVGVGVGVGVQHDSRY
jgi:hypothetical protein